ncbi:GNAT family N-acetyltransferase [Flavobacterium sp. WC2509]|uniref:GNAT family N-acetyltransferase n=1 Tax=Flavobacterium sp. WC2509 TaxID=3461406 RepID=UPI004043F211
MQNELKKTEAYLIENTSTTDLDLIYSFFEEAITYIKKNNYVGWTTYDKNCIKQDISKKLQFKIKIENDILCIFSICFSDALIWRKMEKGDAIYLHRIVVNPKLKGQKQFEKILKWVIELANKKELKYVRMDTWADNSNIIEYYKSYGFQFIENYTTLNTPELPVQHRNLKVALLEMKL